MTRKTLLSANQIRGKVCGAAAVQGNDTIFLGNIDKNWMKEDVMKLLKENEIENIDTLTVVMDPNNTNLNRGFAFLELKTNRDAQRAYKKLQRNDIVGKGRSIKIAWADSFNIPDEEDMLKVKSVYAEGVPDSWNEDRLKETFNKYGEIERIVLGRNIKSAKRRDIAFINYKTREAAISCIESFSSDDLTVNGSKVNLKVALAKRVQKATQNKGQKPIINNSLKETHKPVQALPLQDYSSTVLGTKRSFSALGDGMYSDLRGYPRSRLDGGLGIAGSSYAVMPPGGVGSSLHYQHQSAPAGYSTGSFYQSGSNTDNYQIRQGVPPYSSNLYHRYQM
ncbi:heterogeneous nuclear ribonucleoprotein Q-like [Phalaenopsis equestris]|uniref:heterogeneous nuclear ribonucleoprotein Q-like n=1 Tax=Phalaenopsis equestris TaxID=78828 RepID=UPI0009E4819D|nr:heterogeneous nuclear ribonucleoprotein Q-like [Phalaenopsis equestris]